MVQILKAVNMVDSELVFDQLRNSQNGRFGRLEGLLQKAEGFVDFGEVLVFFRKTP